MDPSIFVELIGGFGFLSLGYLLSYHKLSFLFKVFVGGASVSIGCEGVAVLLIFESRWDIVILLFFGVLLLVFILMSVIDWINVNDGVWVGLLFV